MKLIRLTTNDNGNFKSSFGNEMTLKPFSKMALLNLTFESDIGSRPGMQILPNSSMVILGEVGSAQSGRAIGLNAEDFNGDDIGFEKFRKQIEHYLNALPMLSRGYFTTNEINISGSSFRIIEERGRMEIEFAYSPLVNPFSLVLGLTGEPNSIANNDDAITEVDTSAAGVTTISKVGTDATTNRTNHISTTVPMSRGSGFLMVRIADLIDNTSGLQDNGFGVGLSKTKLTSDGIIPGEDIPMAKRIYEISINTPTDNYKFINNNGIETDSGIPTDNVAIATSGNVNKHDVIGFEMQNGFIKLFVYQDTAAGGTGIRRELASDTFKPGEELYPYIYLRGQKANISLDLFNYTAEPYSLFDDLDVIIQTDNSSNINGYRALLDDNANAKIALQIPSVKAGTDGTLGRWEGDLECEVSIPENILHAFGFSQFAPQENTLFKFTGAIDKQIQVGWISNPRARARALPPTYESDNFIVESISVPLDSYDASDVTYPNTGVEFNANMSNKGRRKNILMTIPENDNNNGIVEFETNTPIFIDINNAETINVKNMDFRVLRKDFSPLNQGTEPAIMTILIED